MTEEESREWGRLPTGPGRGLAPGAEEPPTSAPVPPPPAGASSLRELNLRLKESPAPAGPRKRTREQFMHGRRTDARPPDDRPPRRDCPPIMALRREASKPGANVAPAVHPVLNPPGKGFNTDFYLPALTGTGMHRSHYGCLHHQPEMGDWFRHQGKDYQAWRVLREIVAEKGEDGLSAERYHVYLNLVSMPEIK